MLAASNARTSKGIERGQGEVRVGDFSCDISAFDTNTQRHVIIENQLEATDHRHLGQLITYAAGLDAAIVIWVVPEFREEHRQAIDWLNRHTDDQIDFFGVVLELVRIDNSLPAPNFRAVAFPNAWSKSRATSAPSAPSERAVLYRTFFQPLLDELRDKHRFTNARLAQPQNWYSFRSGVSGITYNLTFASGERMRSEVYIDLGDAALNKAIFDWLLVRKVEIEREMDTALDWERLDQRRASRISVVKSNSSIEQAAANGNEMRTWAVTQLLRIKKVFGPRLEAAVETAGGELFGGKPKV